MEAISDLLFLICLHHMQMHIHMNIALFCSGYFLLCCLMTAKTHFFNVLFKVLYKIILTFTSMNGWEHFPGFYPAINWPVGTSANRPAFE